MRRLLSPAHIICEFDYSLMTKISVAADDAVPLCITQIKYIVCHKRLPPVA
jgi:hypothetical protein